MISRRAFFSTAAASLAAGSLSGADTKTRIGAYYYPWYDSDGRHWSQGYSGRASGSGPKLGTYSSRSPHTIRQHIQWSRDMSIDHWITSWWGPDSWEDHTLRRAVLPLLEKETNAPDCCVFYEAEGLLGLNPDEGIVFDREKTATFAEHFRFLAREYFSHPNYLRFDGKPVVYLYLSRTFRGNYQQAMLRARAAAEAQGYELFLVGDEVYWGEPDRDRIACFDAITSYNMHGPTRFSGEGDWNLFLEECRQVYESYSRVAAGEGVSFIPGILPGFDSTEAGGDHYLIPRNVGPGPDADSTLHAFAEKVASLVSRSHPTMAITSFNEWHEGTQLEPSVGEEAPNLANLAP